MTLPADPGRCARCPALSRPKSTALAGLATMNALPSDDKPKACISSLSPARTGTRGNLARDTHAEPPIAALEHECSAPAAQG
jgi:hypothetical protein